jgi:hypothetical protein
MATTNGAGSFNTQSEGYIQGTAMDDPAARFRLRSGILASDETLPMWGGVGIYEDVAGPLSTPSALKPSIALGGAVGRANIIAGPNAKMLTGFSVFDQAHNMINTPQSPVPLAGSYQTVNFYPLGSFARIAVACDPSLASLEGGINTAQVSWDFVNQRLVPYSPAFGAVTITGATWSNTSGGQISFVVGTDLTSILNAGDDINVSGVVNTGGASAGAFNGAWTVVSVPDSTHVVVAAPAASSIGTYSSGGTITGGGGAVPCTVLNLNIGNSMTVVYDPVTGFATWNRNGSTALIQLV